MLKHRALKTLGETDISIIYDGTQIKTVPIGILNSAYQAYYTGEAFTVHLSLIDQGGLSSGNFFSLSQTLSGVGTSRTDWSRSVLTGVPFDIRNDYYFANNITGDSRAQSRALDSTASSAFSVRIGAATLSPPSGKGYSGAFSYPNYPADDPRLMKVVVINDSGITGVVLPLATQLNAIKYSKVYLQTGIYTSNLYYATFRILPE